MMEEFRILLTNWICALQTLTERGKFLRMQFGEKIQALEKDRGEARELRLSLHQESCDTRSKKIDDVNQWLNQKALISGAPDHFDFSVLIVDDDLAARDSIRRALMSFGAKKQLIIDVQEAKNGREAVYLHLAGASFDIILMDSHMPIMTGREAIKKLRQMGVKSQIIGSTNGEFLGRIGLCKLFFQDSAVEPCRCASVD
ncbi:hypothetical protein OIU77_022556 [Salix suchowensis]|uniref:Response regulatory domain-containing protein n=1 Tax=Salix suchowensis TaxID=1278906 RepID=A0ABQ9C3N9_9ROSI|nr:hypothetical protein OIU77_022556 [Salix suchowensis]